MTEEIRFTAKKGYQPKFLLSFLKPKYFGIWLGFFIIISLAFMPVRMRDKIGKAIGKFIAKKSNRAHKRAFINLSECFPEYTTEQKEKIILDMYITAGQICLSLGEVFVRSKKHLYKRVEVIGSEFITNCKKNIILFAPHNWSIDVAGVLLKQYGIAMCGMYKPQKNALIDYFWYKIRLAKGGGSMHARQNGMRPFLSEIKKGKIGYYLPDEDFGPHSGEYVDFFATKKETLANFTQIAKLTKSDIIPIFTSYDARKGKYTIEIRKPLELVEDTKTMARTANKEIEYFVNQNPAQYTWILELLATRYDNINIYNQ